MSARRLAPALLAALALACGEAPKVTPPSLALSATALSFTGPAGGAAPAAQQVTVTNAGGGTLGTPVTSVAYRSGAGWLTATVSGSAAPYTISVRPSLTGLAAGTYQATVQVATISAANSPRSIDVTLQVSSPSDMALSPLALEFRAVAPGADPAAQAVTVTATGTTPLEVPAATVSYGASAQGWLTATVSGTSAPFTVTVQAATTGLPLGHHEAVVEVAAAGATNSPQQLPVLLFVGRTVDVVVAPTHWLERGATTISIPTGSALSLLQDAGGGTLARTAAVPSTTLGTWTAVIAPGAYLAELTSPAGRITYVPGAADVLDLGVDLAGRPGGATPALPTTVSLELLGLDPWQQDDALQVLAWDADAAADLVPGFGAGNQDDVATLDWASTGGMLLFAEDTLRVHQLRFGVGAQLLTFQELVAATSASGTALLDGTPATITFPVAGTPRDTNTTLAWNTTAMEGASAPFAPSSSGFAHRVGFYAIPAPLAAPSPVGAPASTVFEALLPAEYGDIAGEVLSLGRILPDTWKEYRETAFTTPALRRAPGAGTPVTLSQRVLHREAQPAAGAAGPRISVVQAPLVGGANALLAQAGVPAAAALSWSAPALGTPTSYRVSIVELTAQGGVTSSAPVADFVLQATATSLAPPAGMLVSGRTYAALLTARDNPGDVLGALRTGLPYGEASLWTEAFTIQ